MQFINIEKMMLLKINLSK